MIAEVEANIRNRLGTGIFGADEETLDAITFSAVRHQGWTQTCVELGLSESMQRLLPNLISLAGMKPGSLTGELHKVLNASSATAGLGIACFPHEMAAELAVITPRGEKSIRITYGGHPRNLPRWAFKNGLNLLRLQALAGH